MRFKKDYLKAERVQAGTYAKEDDAIPRIKRLFRSARRHSLNTEQANVLWQNFFNPLRARLRDLPRNRADYDAFALEQIRALAGVLQQQNVLVVGLGDFGIAQKMFN